MTEILTGRGGSYLKYRNGNLSENCKVLMFCGGFLGGLGFFFGS